MEIVMQDVSGYDLKNNRLYTSSKRSRKKLDDDLDVTKLSLAIPRNIMITWKSKNPSEIPEKWKQSYEGIITNMKHWKLYFMDDEDNREFIKKHFPQYLEAYDNFEHNIQRIDFIRYAWLYIHGGLYIDMDLAITKPLDPLFQVDANVFLIQSGNLSDYITNSLMASKPRQNIWIKMMDHAIQKPKWYAIGKHWNVMTTTGPIGLSWVVRDAKITYLTLPAKLCMPCSTCNINNCDTTESWVKPLPGGSWTNMDTAIYNTCMCNWRTITAILLAIIVVVLALFFFYILGYL